MLLSRVHKTYLCRICNKTTGVKVCKCQKAFYCSRNCQKIDWNSHKSDCYKVIDHQTIVKRTTPSLINNAPSDTTRTIELNHNFSNINNNNDDDLSFQQQHRYTDDSDISTHRKHQHDTLEREKREYDPTPLQYQQQVQFTYTNNIPSSTSPAVDDFEENLFNSLMYSVVNESTEQEILKNFNIRGDDLLSTYTLDNNDISPSLNAQEPIEEYVPTTESDEQLLSDKIFDQIQRQQSFENKPETQKLLRETKENLEKELSLFRDSHNFSEEPQQTIDSTSIDEMQLGAVNPKHAAHTRVQDHILSR